MSIQFTAVQTDDLKDYCKQVQVLLNDGWQVVYHHVYYGTLEEVWNGNLPDDDVTPVMTTDGYSDTPVFLGYLQRGTVDGTVNKASVMEVMERRLKRVERLIRQIESLMQGSIDDEAAPTAWVEDQMQLYKTVKTSGNSRFIPLGDIYAEVLAEADAEDALREGNRG